MRRMRTKILTLSLVFLGACTAAQFETFKRVSAATPRIIAQIATAYGSPYAIAIQTFADAIAPAPESSEGQQGTFETSPVLSARDDEMKSTGTVDAPVAEQKLTAQIDIVQEVVKDGRPVAVPVKNGDVLTEDDNYKVQISCNMDCYAYIAQLDATGKMDPILPSNFVAIENPLSGTTSYSIPGGNKWFFLDSNVGVEQVYFIMSKTRRTDIEDIFQEITAANENLTKKASISIDEPMLLEKGIGGIREGQTQSVQFRNGQEGQYLSTTLESIEAELVVTRWFQHR